MNTRPRKSLDKVRVLVVDDHPLFREALVQLLTRQTDLTCCGEAGSASDALARLQREKPDLILLDLRLGKADGLEMIKSFRAQSADVLILVVSQLDEALYAERALRAGANGYLMKEEATEEVLAAIRRVARGSRYLSPRMQERMLQNLYGGKAAGSSAGLDLQQLSDRELEVFRLIGGGSGTREIAEQLHLSIKTVETHRAHLKEKLKLRTGMELIRVAVEAASQSGRRSEDASAL